MSLPFLRRRPKARPEHPEPMVSTVVDGDPSWTIPALYRMAPSADLGTARETLRQLVGELAPDGIDAGTGAALDHLVDAWAAQWIARLDAEHTMREAVCDHLVGVAAEELSATQTALRHAEDDLRRYEDDVAAQRDRLTPDEDTWRTHS
ncbi:hypothetical protein PV396_26575 [Streptomyces sp. ME02-8801-2C]|uniref:hypothetical protein n=1 Tax=Streptomyces sp. ME02-8801-2C TaxID=3028680 RepID=UPI0029B351FC|nr:hypothetical protein [Streptomyces sp. ME02-8801-2C]MDX3455458.1 hypothetical protein [Streptomyces sp. ME02-8801-2C]